MRTEMIKDPDIRSTNVDVDTNAYTITLTGIVRSTSEKNKILTIAKSLGENRDIVDNLSVSNY
jgi:hyperosmotically inducible protein